VLPGMTVYAGRGGARDADRHHRGRRGLGAVVVLVPSLALLYSPGAAGAARYAAEAPGGCGGRRWRCGGRRVVRSPAARPARATGAGKRGANAAGGRSSPSSPWIRGGRLAGLRRSGLGARARRAGPGRPARLTVFALAADAARVAGVRQEISRDVQDWPAASLDRVYPGQPCAGKGIVMDRRAENRVTGPAGSGPPWRGGRRVRARAAAGGRSSTPRWCARCSARRYPGSGTPAALIGARLGSAPRLRQRTFHRPRLGTPAPAVPGRGGRRAPGPRCG